MSTFYTSLIVVGIILLFITVGSNSENALNGTIAGYSLIGGGILLLVSYLFLGILKNQNNANNLSVIMSFIYTGGPFFVILGIIAYIIYLLITHKNRIIEGNVSPGYVNFTNISILLILIQLYLFYLGTGQENFKKTSRLSKVYSMLLYFVGIMNIVTVITINIILVYFSTDG